MSSEQEERYPCPECGKSYRLVPQVAGHRVQCRQCGTYFQMPRLGQAPPLLTDAAPKVVQKTQEADPYELNLEEPTAAAAPVEATKPAASKCPSCGSQVKSGAVLCINCGYNFKTGRAIPAAQDLSPPIDTEPAMEPALQETIDLVEADAQLAAPKLIAPAQGGAGSTGGETFKMPSYLAAMAGRRAVTNALESGEDDADSRVTEVYAPLSLVGIGAVLVLVNALLLGPMAYEMKQQMMFGPGPSSGAGFVYSIFCLVYAGVRLVIQLPLMVIAIFLVARIFGSAYGSLWTGILKLTAISLMVGGASDCLSSGLDIITEGFGGIGWMINQSITAGLFGALCMWLLEMDVLEALVMYLLVFFFPFVLMGFVGTMLLAMF